MFIFKPASQSVELYQSVVSCALNTEDLEEFYLLRYKACIISQKIELFITAAVRTSDPT
jgi:hypothetical protein